MHEAGGTHGWLLIWALGWAGCVAVPASLQAEGPEKPRDFFANPSFELGRDGWTVSRAGKTECSFSVDQEGAADGKSSVLVKVGAVEDWGAQFGQQVPAGEKGKTYTFAVFARSTKGTIDVSLQIERSARPWDRAARSEKFKLTSRWQELHVTFEVEKDFPEGWFAYIDCAAPQVQFRCDMFRLHEGPYVPYEDIARQEAASARQERVAVGVRWFDAGTAATAPWPGEALARRAGWTEVLEDDVSHAFKGDAVLANDRIACVIRRGAKGAEVYSMGPGAPSLRAVLAPAPGGTALSLSSFTIAENSAAAGAAEALFAAPDGNKLAIRYGLQMGQPFVETEAREGVSGLQVEAPCRFALLPDFFADDIVIDAAELPVPEAELPSDSFLLHLAPDRRAIVMTVVKESPEDIRLALSGQGEERAISSSELRHGKDGKIWVGILAAPAIWHVQEVAGEQAGTVIRLDWEAPFPAQWRMDWRRDNGLCDSWEMLVERPDGSFVKHGMFGGPDTIPADRLRWTTVLGQFKYPCWVDKSGRGHLQPLKSRALRFSGPAIIYPLSRSPATALDTFTVVDIARNTLGVGPCEYILDVEGQPSAYKGMATCAVRDTLNPIYERRQQKQRKAEIERVLQDLMTFIRHIRGRIEGYVAFGHETLDYLAEQRKAHPELAERLAELEVLAREIDARVAARKDQIKTPEKAAEMVAEFRRTVLGDEGDDALARCKRFTEAWVAIGGNQDELVGECRWAVKMIRQRAGLLLALDPRVTEVAKEIRLRSQKVLRSPAGHEGARH